MKFKLFLILLISILSGCGNEPLKIKKIQGQQLLIDAAFIQDSSLLKFVQPYKNKLSKEINAVLCYNTVTLSRKEANWHTLFLTSS